MDDVGVHWWWCILLQPTSPTLVYEKENVCMYHHLILFVELDRVGPTDHQLLTYPPFRRHNVGLLVSA